MCFADLVGYLRWDPLSESLKATDIMEDNCLIDNCVSSSSTTTILTSSQSVRAALPPVLSADSRAFFAVPSVVYNLHNYTVHNIGSST